MIARQTYMKYDWKAQGMVKQKSLTAKQVREGRTYMKSFMTEWGIEVKVGDMVVWDWSLTSGPRMPKKVLAIFTDSQLKYYDEQPGQVVWADLEGLTEAVWPFHTFDGKSYANTRRPINLQSDFLWINCNFRIINKQA